MAELGRGPGLRSLLASCPSVALPGPSRDIPLAPSEDDGAEAALRRIFKTTAFHRVGHDHVRLQGTDMSHHHVDPALRGYGSEPYPLRWLRLSGERCDLCCEDSWSGYFIADHLATAPDDEPLVMVHVDDHTDMSAMLIGHGAGTAVDLVAGTAFDPAASDDWLRAIASGIVGIGNFITPFLLLPRSVHVRHLCESLPPLPAERLELTTTRHALVPGLVFATPKAAGAPTAAGNSHARSASASELMAGLPSGRLVVHVDLDYFVNDFNGNPGGHERRLDDDERRSVLRRMDDLFKAIAAVNRPISRWIVATSPGFCAFRHWAWLLRELGDRIDAIARSRRWDPVEAGIARHDAAYASARAASHASLRKWPGR